VNRQSSFFRHVIDGLLLATLSLGALYATARTGLKPREPASGLAVVFAPWTTPDIAFRQAAAAGGRFVRFGAFQFIAVVIPEDIDYKYRVLGRGAWLVLDPKALAACLSAFTNTAQNR
jgi:hypothetical protein